MVSTAAPVTRSVCSDYAVTTRYYLGEKTLRGWRRWDFYDQIGGAEEQASGQGRRLEEGDVEAEESDVELTELGQTDNDSPRRRDPDREYGFQGTASTERSRQRAIGRIPRTELVELTG